MKTKLHLLLFLFLGAFLMPTTSFACGTTCKKEKMEKEIMKDHCKKDKSSEKQDGCGGKCKNQTCQTSASNFNLLLPNAFDFKINYCDFVNKKESFSFYESCISSGFFSIWTPPNIG
jgi:hypothetical protein